MTIAEGGTAPDGEYRGAHRAPSREDGAPLHRAGEMFDGVYDNPALHRHDTGPTYAESLREIVAARGEPERTVTMYRAMPADARDAALAAGDPAIRPGDWVTLSQAYAQQHAMVDDDPEHDWPVVSQQVLARHLFTDGNDVNEWAFQPD